jgi:hypothetical protein
MKTMKLGLGLAAIFAAAPARAEISMEMGVEGYVPGSYSRAAELRAGQLERLAAAAERLEASADAVGSEVLLAGLYSGSVAAEKASPVYAAAAAALPAPVTLPVKSARRAVAVKSAIEQIGADAPAAGDGAAVEAEDADAGPAESPATADAAGDKEEDEDKPTAGSMLLATLIVVALAFLILYAPLLLVAL